MVFSALEFQRPSPLPMRWTMMLHFRVQNYCIAMKSTEVLNPWRNDIDRQKACSHPQTDCILYKYKNHFKEDVGMSDQQK